MTSQTAGLTKEIRLHALFFFLPSLTSLPLETVSLCNSSWHGTGCVDQDGHKATKTCLPLLLFTGVTGGHHHAWLLVLFSVICARATCVELPEKPMGS